MSMIAPRAQMLTLTSTVVLNTFVASVVADARWMLIVPRALFVGQGTAASKLSRSIASSKREKTLCFQLDKSPPLDKS